MTAINPVTMIIFAVSIAIALLWLLCFDRDILAHNSIMKVKLKVLERVNLSFLVLCLLVFESCP